MIDAAARELCAGQPPDWKTINRFRDEAEDRLGKASFIDGMSSFE